MTNLTKEQEAAKQITPEQRKINIAEFILWEKTFFLQTGMRPTKLDAWRGGIRHRQPEIDALREAITGIEKAWTQPYDGTDSTWTDNVQNAIDEAKRKAGV